MSRVARMPVKIPAGVEVKIVDGLMSVKGAKTSLNLSLPSSVQLESRMASPP